MSAWIGPLGNLIEFKCPSAVESASDDPHVYFRPLGGDVTVTRLGDGTRPRVWDVSISTAFPEQVATLQGLAEGSWGIGPWVFIPPGAASLNLLGKREALSLGDPGAGYVLAQGGAPVMTAEGPAGASYATTSATQTPQTKAFGNAPVIPGQPVTGKAWVQALNGTTGHLSLGFYTAGHTQIGSLSTVTTTDPSGVFLSTTVTAPAGAAYARLRGAGATLTRPSVTWTAEPRVWATSKASQNVVVSPLSDAVRRATGAVGEEQITDHRFTVTELRA